MSRATSPAKVFSIPFGAPFLSTFARALCDGRIIAGLADPLALAGVTIYVPTRRAGRALAQELALACGQPALLLPAIRPLGVLDDDQNALLFDDMRAEGALDANMPPAIGALSRQMLLTSLVLKWSEALAHAIVRFDARDQPELISDEPLLVANSVAGAWHLAGDLAGLIDELIIEDVAWGKLAGLGEEFDEYWRITTHFLDIAMEQWPLLLNARGVVDAARRQALLTERQIAHLQTQAQQGPVIALGSTGTNRTVARLLAAIARAPQGAVVLPGLDKGLDAASFASIGSLDPVGEVSGATHPQAALARLLPILAVAAADVIDIGTPIPELAARARFVTQALRPADSTDLWGKYLAAEDGGDCALALADIAMIEAGDEREEALCLAIAMREVLEREGQTAALITPNRGLATRVKAELMRWNIAIDDSGGEPLGVSIVGSLAQLALACSLGKHRAKDQIALLSHPLVRLGMARGEIERLTPLIEVGILRVVLPDDVRGDPGELVAAAIEAAARPHAHPALVAISNEEWQSIEVLLCALGKALKPLDAVAGAPPLATWVEAHRSALALLICGSEPLEGAQDWHVLMTVLDELHAASLDVIAFDGESYAAFLARLMRETIVRGPNRAHPRLKILGLLEARLLEADVVLLGGLDETIWPPQSRGDAFLNRPMRAKLGLTTPERRIGQTAHDFVQALGNRRVMISRAKKRGGSPMVASRFLQRMAALAGPHWQGCIERGGRFVELAHELDQAVLRRQIARPAPCPKLALRPAKLSITRIETLRRDPYAIYGEKVLQLTALEPLGIEVGSRERGTLLHEVLAEFVVCTHAGPHPDQAMETLTAIARLKMADLLANAEFTAFQWPRVLMTLKAFLDFDANRRAMGANVIVEAFGTLDIALADGSNFKLTGRADRIEVFKDGKANIFDYKTGGLPTHAQINNGFAPQLLLEALMLDRGGFDKVAKNTKSQGAAYLKLGASDSGKVMDIGNNDRSFAELLVEQEAGLLQLLNHFRDFAHGYPSKPYPQFVPRFSDFDHLARVAEWSAGNAVAED